MKFFYLALLLLVNCSPNNKTHKPVSVVDVVPAGGVSSGTSFVDVQPVFQKLCSGCHPSRQKPNWQVYSEAMVYVKNGLLHRNVVVARIMPSIGSPEASMTTEADRKLISDWIEGGALEVITANSQNPGSNIVTTTPTLLDMTPNFAKSCVGCHDSQGSKLNYSTGTPNIDGQNADYIYHQLMNYKWYKRIDPNHQMNQQAAMLSDDEITQVSNYFSKLILKEKNTDLRNLEIKKIYNLGRSIAQNACVHCHMKLENNYNSISGLIPQLKGQSEIYLLQQLIFYQKGIRENSLMQNIVQGMSNEQIQAVSIYFSNTTKSLDYEK